MLQTFLSFILASFWVIGMTLVAERFGSRRGGVLVTLPSTIIVALLFIGLDGGTELAVETARTIPAGMGINIVFLLLFVSTIKLGLGKALATSMAGWFLLALSLYLLHPDSIIVTLTIYTIAALTALAWFGARRNYEGVGGSRVKYRPREIAFRGLFAGSVIAFAVFMSTVGGPVISAILSVFPAIFLSTMIILYTRQGEEFTGAIGTTMIPGTFNIVVYSVAAYLVFPSCGPVFGTVIVVIISYIWSTMFYYVMTR